MGDTVKIFAITLVTVGVLFAIVSYKAPDLNAPVNPQAPIPDNAPVNPQAPIPGNAPVDTNVSIAGNGQSGQGCISDSVLVDFDLTSTADSLRSNLPEVVKLIYDQSNVLF